MCNSTQITHGPLGVPREKAPALRRAMKRFGATDVEGLLIAVADLQERYEALERSADAVVERLFQVDVR